MSSLESRITKIEKELLELRKELKKPNDSKVDKLVDCTTKVQVAKFTISELKDYIKKNKLKTNGAALKEDFVKIVFKALQENENESENQSESEEDYESDEEYEWEYY